MIRLTRILCAGTLASLVLASCHDFREPVAVEREPQLSRSDKLAAIDLGTLGGSLSVATGVNNKGEIVGFSTTASGERRAFLWTVRDGMQSLGTAGGVASAALAISSQGAVVGWSQDAAGETHAFVWTWAEGMTLLPHLDGEDFSHALDVNDAGSIVGFSGVSASKWQASGDVSQIFCSGGAAFGVNNFEDVVGVESGAAGGFVDIGDGSAEFTGVLFTRTGTCQPLVQGSVLAMSANGINEDRAIAGSGGHFEDLGPDAGLRLLGPVRPQRWVDGQPDFVSPAEGAAVAVNLRGDMVGYFGEWSYGDAGAVSAFLWSRQEGSILLPAPNAVRSSAMSTNSRGDVVGWLETESGERRAILWSRPGRYAKWERTAQALHSRATVAGESGSNVTTRRVQFLVTTPCPAYLQMLVEVGASNACGAVEQR